MNVGVMERDEIESGTSLPEVKSFLDSLAFTLSTISYLVSAYLLYLITQL
jgi:hypothetical protein